MGHGVVPARQRRNLVARPVPPRLRALAGGRIRRSPGEPRDSGLTRMSPQGIVVQAILPTPPALGTGRDASRVAAATRLYVSDLRPLLPNLRCFPVNGPVARHGTGASGLCVTISGRWLGFRAPARISGASAAG